MNIFVTGGSRGIGKAAVLDAVAQNHNVAFTYANNESAAAQVVKEAQAINSDAKITCYHLDQKDSQEVESVFDRVINDFGSMEAVICNAGVNDDGLLFSMSNEQWHHVIETNLTGSFYVARQFLQEFIAQRFGRFVFLSSIISNGGTGQVNYAASKAGIIGISGTIAKEYAAKGICSNVVIPGFFDTDMTRNTMSEELKKFWLQYCPQKRLGKMEEMTKLLLFLCSENNGFINGQVISSTGGLDWSY